MSKKNILVTGISSGFGQAIAAEALSNGDTLIGTVRKESDRQTVLATMPDCHCYLLDVTEHGSISNLIETIINQHGHIDVLINNAGYGHEGILEESTIDDMRQQFEVNVFGPVAMVKAVLPYMRAQKSGHIVNITSMGGFITMPGIAYYCGSKFALEGISEVLSKELAQLNIKVTAVAPGSFKTDWAGRSMIRTQRFISDYDELFNPIREKRKQASGKQLGNPKLAAEAILNVIHHSKPPVHLLLGSDALTLVRDKMTWLSSEIDKWQDTTKSTDSASII